MQTRINPPYKEEASIVSNRSSQHEEHERHDQSVAKVKQARNELIYLQLGEEVEDRVKEHVEGGGTGSQERSPPPMVVLKTKYESTCSAFLLPHCTAGSSTSQ